MLGPQLQGVLDGTVDSGPMLTIILARKPSMQQEELARMVLNQRAQAFRFPLPGRGIQVQNSQALFAEPEISPIPGLKMIISELLSIPTHKRRGVSAIRFIPLGILSRTRILGPLEDKLHVHNAKEGIAHNRIMPAVFYDTAIGHPAKGETVVRHIIHQPGNSFRREHKSVLINVNQPIRSNRKCHVKGTIDVAARIFV